LATLPVTFKATSPPPPEEQAASKIVNMINTIKKVFGNFIVFSPYENRILI
jgi:hypothetical protein